MAPLPSRAVLQSMKRTELQNLCKEYGVRANLKSEALIELLLQTQSGAEPPPARRSVSSMRQPSRAGPSRTTSLIIHDIEEEQESDMDTGNEEANGQTSADMLSEPPDIPPPQPVRTRKAKDLQTRLGVGRPTAAGGSGARAVTKSTSVPRGRRGRSSRAMSRVDATIPEEVEPSPRIPTPKQPSEQPVEASTSDLPSGELSYIPRSDLESHIAHAIRPLQVRVEGLEEELKRSLQQNEKLAQIQQQLDNVSNLQQRYDALEAEVQAMRADSATIASLVAEFKELKGNLGSAVSTPPALPSTPKPKSPRLPPNNGLGPGFPSDFNMGYPPMMDRTPIEMTGPSGFPNHMPSAKMLGKRPRSSSPGNASGIVEGGQTDGLTEEQRARTVTRPDKKRARLDDDMQTAASSSSKQADVSPPLLVPRIPSFPPFQSRETSYSTPPASTLPEVYRPITPPGAPLLPPARTGPSRATANEDSQRRPFDFSLFPGGSEGEGESYIQPIPFPAAPQSPSPAGGPIGYMHQLQDDRTDPFKEFGFPSPRRSRVSSSTSVGASGKRGDITSNDIAAGLGLTQVRTGTPELTETPPGGKTMYGTELDGETRFGDFGVGGVASGFWSTR